VYKELSAFLSDVTVKPLQLPVRDLSPAHLGIFRSLSCLLDVDFGEPAEWLGLAVIVGRELSGRWDTLRGNNFWLFINKIIFMNDVECLNIDGESIKNDDEIAKSQVILLITS
jgi:hypothetical protein